MILLVGIQKAGITSEPGHWAGNVEAASFYWHFVDGIWILLFTVIYLIQ